jgi:phospholipid/cholesterol/gamma-HCH transport system ATP-binding protein
VTGRTPAVRFDHVTKSFGAKTVLNDVSFDVNEGEALCILGRSGTGKSVTLKLIVSLLKPDQGRIFIGPHEITTLDESGLLGIRRGMGFLFQDAALFDSFTLRENLSLPLKRLTEKSLAEIEVAVDRALCQVGLANDGHKMPAEMSGGMRKRAGLARALVLEPRILLADEPASGLDRITASEIDDLLLRQKTEHNMTLIIVTHDVRGARRVGDRILVLDRGRVIADGDAADVERSANEVARELVAE